MDGSCGCKITGNDYFECDRHLMEKTSKEVKNLLLSVFKEVNQEDISNCGSSLSSGEFTTEGDISSQNCSPFSDSDQRSVVPSPLTLENKSKKDGNVHSTEISPRNDNSSSSEITPRDETSSSEITPRDDTSTSSSPLTSEITPRDDTSTLSSPLTSEITPRDDTSTSSSPLTSEITSRDDTSLSSPSTSEITPRDETSSSSPLTSEITPRDDTSSPLTSEITPRDDTSLSDVTPRDDTSSSPSSEITPRYSSSSSPLSSEVTPRDDTFPSSPLSSEITPRDDFNSNIFSPRENEPNIICEEEKDLVDFEIVKVEKKRMTVSQKKELNEKLKKLNKERITKVFGESCDGSEPQMESKNTKIKNKVNKKLKDIFCESKNEKPDKIRFETPKHERIRKIKSESKRFSTPKRTRVKKVCSDMNEKDKISDQYI